MSKKSLLILAIVEAIVIVGLILIGPGQILERLIPSEEETPTYNILDGVIREIDYQKPDSFVILVDTTLIPEANKTFMEKIIRFNELTEWTSYDKNKKEEMRINFTEAKKGDFISVFTTEPLSAINDIEEFTALKVMIFK